MTNTNDTHIKEDINKPKSTATNTTVSSDDLLKPPAKAAKANDSSDHETEMAELKKQHQEALHQQKIQYLADLENTRKIHKREEEKARDFGIQRLAKDLLNIADALHQGITTCPEDQKQGLEMILQLFDKTLHQHHIEAIIPKQGDVYDHNTHEAMVTQPTTEVPNNHILQVIQNGYQIKTRLLRPARVIVAKNTENEEKS